MKNRFKEFLLKKKLKKDYDFLFVDFHGEITSEKAAMGHFFDGKATLLVGTHTHIPTNDARILNFGTAYQTDAGMCGDYNSVIGMNKENSLKRFFKEDSKKHFPLNSKLQYQTHFWTYILQIHFQERVLLNLMVLTIYSLY